MGAKKGVKFEQKQTEYHQTEGISATNRVQTSTKRHDGEITNKTPKDDDNGKVFKKGDTRGGFLQDITNSKIAYKSIQNYDPDNSDHSKVSRIIEKRLIDAKIDLVRNPIIKSFLKNYYEKKMGEKYKKPGSDENSTAEVESVSYFSKTVDSIRIGTKSIMEGISTVGSLIKDGLANVGGKISSRISSLFKKSLKKAENIAAEEDFTEIAANLAETRIAVSSNSIKTEQEKKELDAALEGNQAGIHDATTAIDGISTRAADAANSTINTTTNTDGKNGTDNTHAKDGADNTNTKDGKIGTDGKSGALEHVLHHDHIDTDDGDSGDDGDDSDDGMMDGY